MRELIVGLQDILERVKGFTCGSSSKDTDHMIINHNNKRYLISIKEIENPNEDMFKDIDKYLK